MLRRLMPIAAVLLFAAPAAEAKGPPDGVKVCGAGGACVAIGRQDAERMPLWSHASRPVAPGGPAPYYVLHYRWRSTDPEETTYWIPSRNLARFVSPSLVSWFRVPKSSLEEFTGDLAPVAAPRITSVTVGSRSVRAPATYLRLFSVGHATTVWPAVSGWLRVRFTARAPSPWTDASAGVRISTDGGYLLRDDTVFTIPKRIADRARRGLSLA
jgi:hypothetical protein